MHDAGQKKSRSERLMLAIAADDAAALAGIDMSSHKACIECLEVKHLSSFWPAPGSTGARGKGVSGICYACRTIKSRAAYAKHKADVDRNRERRRKREINKEKINRQKRDHRLIERYGISVADYDAASVLQGGVCAICESPEVDCVSGRFSIDHDHETGEVRGLLCRTCNAGLGQFGDNPDLLRVAIMYLENPPMRFVKKWEVAA